jgi:hypothetical protein
MNITGLVSDTLVQKFLQGIHLEKELLDQTYELLDQRNINFKR